MKPPFACLLALCVFPVFAAEAPKPAVFHEVNKLTNQLASSDGFSDDDATQVAVLFLGNLLGPMPAKHKLTTRVVESKPGSVTIHAGYDSGIITTGFRFRFERGNPKNGVGYARFLALEYVPDA